MFQDFKKIYKSIYVRGCEVLVSEDGDVWGRYAEKWIPRKPRKRGLHGYMSVRVAGKDFYVHRLVAFAFGVYPTLEKIPGLDVDHIDNDRYNNHYTNLQLLTRSENLAKEKQFIRDSMNYHYQAIKPVEGGEIVVAASVTEMARLLGVDKSFVSQVCLGKRKSCKGYIVKRILNDEAKILQEQVSDSSNNQ